VRKDKESREGKEEIEDLVASQIALFLMNIDNCVEKVSSVRGTSLEWLESSLTMMMRLDESIVTT
jgi:hypothetical protein